MMEGYVFICLDFFMTFSDGIKLFDHLLRNFKLKSNHELKIKSLFQKKRKNYEKEMVKSYAELQNVCVKISKSWGKKFVGIQNR